MNKFKAGAHVSIAKGLIAALSKIQKMGGNCLQIFSSAPQQFSQATFSESEIREFRKTADELNISPVFVHGMYLINLGSENPVLLDKSIKNIISDMVFAEKIGSRGVIIHTGSHKGRGFNMVLDQVVQAVKNILDNSKTAKLYLEIASGGGGKIGATFEELATILSRVKNKRLGICLDTAHMFAGGYGFDTEEKVNQLDQNIINTVGWTNVECVHVNDSKSELGSKIDRHENLGEGKIGLQSLRLLLNSPNFNKLPLILETPGFDDQGPDKKNLEILKSLLEVD